MKKLIFLFLIINSSLFAQHTNVFRDSTVFTKAVTLVPTYADDAAAGVGGLTSGQLYKTTTLGSTYLKIVS